MTYYTYKGYRLIEERVAGIDYDFDKDFYKGEAIVGDNEYVVTGVSGDKVFLRELKNGDFERGFIEVEQGQRTLHADQLAGSAIKIYARA
jgi:hypothetical protein